MAEEKHIFIHNFGCQMNLHDARRMEEVLRPLGYTPTSRADEADLIVVNTCSVRDKVQAKVLTALGRYAQLKERNPRLVVGVAGCVAQQEGERLFKAAPCLDLILGPDHIAALPRLLEQVASGRSAQVGFVDVDDYTFLRAAPRAGGEGPTALVTIQKGCDNHCAYCIVPLVRGPEVSRPLDDVVGEVEDLVAAGVKEVTLIGQNVNSYRGDAGRDGDFVRLLRRVDAVPGLQRLRFTTSHPRDFSSSLSACFGELPRLCPWLHLPVQSGANPVLASMNRGYTREGYLRAVREVRQVRPDLSIGTDLIVGFPGERADDFQETLSLVEEIQFDYSFSFKYSVRPGTAAAQLLDDVPEEEKSRRLTALQACQDRITRGRLAARVGQRLEVLVEGWSRRGQPQLSGRTPGNQVVNFESRGDVATGMLVEVRITEAGSHSLMGELQGAPEAG